MLTSAIMTTTRPAESRPPVTIATDAGARKAEGVGPPFVPSKTTLVAGGAARTEARKGMAETIAPATKARREIVKGQSSASEDKPSHPSGAMSNVRFPPIPDLGSAHASGAQ